MEGAHPSGLLVFLFCFKYKYSVFNLETRFDLWAHSVERRLPLLCPKIFLVRGGWEYNFIPNQVVFPRPNCSFFLYFPGQA